ncbi:hypothetical protein GCM10009789_16050 [Kribbella sancticallisti]|uniref:Uncharacterized protein n=1 Tax=Kribbella sancticallisti TaxID=460087 RepID=A0ABP4NPI9_9ACTN
MAIVYVGIPLVLLALTVWISAGAETFNWLAVLLPLAVLIAGWFFRRRSRYKPSRWNGAGALLGAVAGIYPVALAGSVWLVLPAAIVGAIIGAALGRYGERRLMQPAIAELADTQYELAFRVRGLTTLRLFVDDKSVSLRERVRTGAGSVTYPLEAITGVHDVSVTGAERLRFPMALRLPPAGSPGPALILQAQGTDWVLPQDDAAAIAQILNRRIEAA